MKRWIGSTVVGVFVLAALILAGGALSSGKDGTKAMDKETMKLVWSDEFDRGRAPDPEKWGYEVGFVRNRELQYYTEKRQENVRIKHGMLVIESRKEKWPNPDHDPGARGNWQKEREHAEYTSGSITTRGKAHWLYGRVEVRAKLPTGKGMWPAIWMLGINRGERGWPLCGEIDIMENVGFDPDRVHATVHTQAYNHTKGTQKGGSAKTEAPYDKFHVYSVVWGPEEMMFYVDDKKIFEFANEHTGKETWPFDEPHFLILNAAVGGAWGGSQGMDESIFPQKYHIDYVRVYQ